MKPVIYWIRRDFRLRDNMALAEAARLGVPVLPVFILDEVFEAFGAAPKFRLEAALRHFQKSVGQLGTHLILRKGPALETLRELALEVGAGAVYWNRLYDPASIARDRNVKAALKAQGFTVRSFAGHVLFEPWNVQTKTGGFYKVYTPFWKAVRARDVIQTPIPAPAKLIAPAQMPASEDLNTWQLSRAMQAGAPVLAPYLCVGEDAAQDRLASFLHEKVSDYGSARDYPWQRGTSRLSEPLAYGEISPAACWQGAWRAMRAGKTGAEIFLKELAWRDFAYHLAYHTPHITTRNWREDWDSFPWNTDETPQVLAWKQGRTGVPLVDAAMREMYVSGMMHNRGRMIVASYLTKHLLTHWKIGLRWFEECLIDWDPASNAMGWQWSAGSGPDATPYFRIFNPETQAAKFDKGGAYRRAWLAEPYDQPTATALAFFQAAPKSWALSPDLSYPAPIVGLAEGRARALSAYSSRSF